ncbi:MAG: hypothetical protein LBO77_07625 [Desulfovibrio sp.]|jgi:hypothetical protein|nr:hypothetical protein [Desulfovibrio sp.]
MNPDGSSPSAAGEKTEKSSRSKGKFVRILPLLITALFFGYRQVAGELEKKEQKRAEYAVKAAVREIAVKEERQRRLKDLFSDLPQDIVAAFAEPGDSEAFGRIWIAATEDSGLYAGAVNRVLQSGGHKTALQAALLYCREIDPLKGNNKKENLFMGACLEKFGFQTAVTGDSLTISAEGGQPEKAPAQGD